MSESKSLFFKLLRFWVACYAAVTLTALTDTRPLSMITEVI